MKIWKNLLCLLILSTVTVTTTLYAQQTEELNTGSDNRLVFERLFLGRGLLQNTVSCIVQDRKGFLWIGTADGLIRYDGYNLTVYRYDPQNPQSLSHDAVQAIYEDHTGILWIGTRDGLNAFDRGTEKFLRYYHDSNNPQSLSVNSVSAIYEDRSGVLWIGTDGRGLNRFDRETGQFVRYLHNDQNPESLSSNFIRSIYEDRTGTLWIATLAEGLNRFDRKRERFFRYQHDPNAPYSLSHNAVRTIYEDHAETLWIGTFGGGLNRFDRKTEQFVAYQHNPNTLQSLSHNKVLTILEDQSGVLWVGTEGGGLNRFDRKTEQFVHYQTIPNDSDSLSHNIVTSLYEDRSGILWIGTEGEGLNKLIRETKLFRHVQLDSIVLSLYEDRSGILWIGTYGKGLIQFNRERNRFTHYLADPDNPDSLSSNIVLAIVEDRKGSLWIGTKDGGLNRFDRETKRFFHYQYTPNNPQSLSHSRIQTIYEDQSGILWIGTEGGGLNRFDRETEHFTHYQYDSNNPQSLSDNDVWAIYEDNGGVLWIGTGGGLDRFDRKTEQIFHYQTSPVRSLHEHKSGMLWIGTRGGGLYKFDRTQETLTQYTMKDGLPGDVIYGILEDAQGNLWLSTDRNGLSRFDPHTETYANFDGSNGLQSETFTPGAYYKNLQGEMLFGGLNGVTVFHPERIKRNPHIPPVVITDFQLFHTPVRIAHDSPLKTAITEAQEITLSYRDNVLSFEFAALDYTAPENNQYAYMLDGVDKDWVSAGTRRFVTYTHLKPGRYTFSVKGSNNDGVWNEEGTSLHIIITPPWWETVWFRILAAMLIIGGVLGTFTLRIKSIERHRQILEQQVWERTSELAAAKKRIETSHHMLHTVLNNLDALIYVADMQTYKILFVTDRFKREIGDVVGLICWQTLQDGQTGPCHFCTNSKLLTANGKPIGIYHQEYQNTRNNRWYAVTSSAIEWIDGRIVRVSMETDITNLKQTEETLREAKKAADSANRAKSEFLANMSHELRTPLNAILGFAQIMARAPHMPEEQENLGIIMRSGEHLLTLINQVLDLSKIEAGRITLDEKTVHLHRLLDDLEDMFSLKAQKEGLNLVFERTDDVPRYVQTDEVKLRQVLINLLNNAIKFTEEGEVKLKIENCQLNIENRREEEEHPQSSICNLQFSISDTGPGIPPQEMETLFEAFTQTETGRHTQEGTGLGLPISKKFVQLMGGDIFVRSEVGRGTTFIFDIQVGLVDQSTIDNQRSTIPKRVIGLETGQPQYRFLIVDDNPDNRKMLVKLLSNFSSPNMSSPVSGFELKEATNGQEAIDLWKTWQPHLIWMDMRMPVMDGYEATRQIRKVEEQKGRRAEKRHADSQPVIPQSTIFQPVSGQATIQQSTIRTVIIAVTASIFEEEQAVVFSAGCDDFLRKPFRDYEIFDLLHKHLGVRFVYEDVGAQGPVPLLTPEALSALPEELQTELHHAVEAIDLEAALSLIEQIREHNDPLADALVESVNGYRFDILQALFEQSEGNKKD